MMARLRRLIWASWTPIAERAARAYIAGPAFSDALRVCRSLARLGMAATICPWDRPGEAPLRVTDSYLAALRGLSGAGDGGKLDCSLSLKAPSLKFSERLFDEVRAAAREAGIAVHFDSLGPEDVDRTWPLIRAAAAELNEVGCTLPARWRRSGADAERALELGLRVRVVKGQWPDHPNDAPGLSMRDAFLTLVDRLAGRARHVAVATHDAALARESLARLRRSGTPAELELLLGLPTRAPLSIARAAGVSVRVYVPYGHGYLPYGLSQARRQPRVLWWTLKDLVRGASK